MATSEHGRDGISGRYVHTTDALCTCGHPLSVHSAARNAGGEPGQPCFNGDRHQPGADGTPCACALFTKARRRRAAAR